MALIDEAKMGERDIAAQVAILEHCRRMEEDARSLRLRIAMELGFDARHPRDVKVGDTIRTAPNCWHKVTSRTHLPADAQYAAGGTGLPPSFEFVLDDTTVFIVEDVSEDHPVGPVSVLVASPEPSSVF